MRTIAIRIDQAELEAIHADMATAGLPALTDEQVADLAFVWGMREVQGMYATLAGFKREASDK